MNTAGDCRHYNGVIGPGSRKGHRCRAGVDYRTVRDSVARPYLWPCLQRWRGRGCRTSCAALEPLTQFEADAQEREMQQLIDDAVAGLCPQCGRPCEEHDSPDVLLLVCPKHGVVVRGCKRISEEP